MSFPLCIRKVEGREILVVFNKKGKRSRKSDGKMYFYVFLQKFGKAFDNNKLKIPKVHKKIISKFLYFFKEFQNSSKQTWESFAFPRLPPVSYILPLEMVSDTCMKGSTSVRNTTNKGCKQNQNI